MSIHTPPNPKEELYDRLADKIHEICKEHYGPWKSTPSMQITDEIFPIIEPLLALESVPRARWWAWIWNKLFN